MKAVALDGEMVTPIRRCETSKMKRRQAFGALIQEHDRNLRMLAYRLMGDVGAMDDVLQDAYLKAYRAFESFDERSTAGTWLYRITYNCCLDRLRALKRERKHFGEMVSIDALAEDGVRLAASDDTATDVEGRNALAATLASLPIDQRAVVLLVDVMGYDYQAAAEVLGIEPGTVGSRLNRARAALRVVLAEEATKEEQ